MVAVRKRVEAKNFVPNYGHSGRTEPVVQPATRKRRPVLFWERKKASEHIYLEDLGFGKLFGMIRDGSHRLGCKIILCCVNTGGKR